MNKFKMLKNSISSTIVLTTVIWFCITVAMMFLPICIEATKPYVFENDMVIYSEEIADYAFVHFAKRSSGLTNFELYGNLEKRGVDMENFAGTAVIGQKKYIDKESNGLIENEFAITIVSEKMVEKLPSLGFEFSRKIRNDYKEAYIPMYFKDEFKEGDEMPLTVNEGEYTYSVKLKIKGYTGKDYYDFNGWGTNDRLSDTAFDFIIYDDIPWHGKIKGGLMMGDKRARDYVDLGFDAESLREIKERRAIVVLSYDDALILGISIMILVGIIVGANYYFSVDKMTKRSGVMCIFGGKRSDIVVIEFIKMLLIFVVAMMVAMLVLFLMSLNILGVVSVSSCLISIGVVFAIYIVSVSFGFIKFARFKPLEAISNYNVE